jgi:hypothetical protein
VEACLTKDNVDGGTPTNTQTVAPPGYRWAQRTAGFLGARPDTAINACHLLGKQLGGSGTDLKNLATCSNQANYVGTSMRTYENQVRAAVDAGQEVHYTVTPIYQGQSDRAQVVPHHGVRNEPGRHTGHPDRRHHSEYPEGPEPRDVQRSQLRATGAHRRDAMTEGVNDG